MRDPEQEEVLDSIVKGIQNAQRDYEKAYKSDIVTPEYTPQYLTTVYIFQSIFKLKRKRQCKSSNGYGIALEQRLRKTVTGPLKVELKVDKRKLDKEVPLRSKCDLLLLDINDDPRAVVEVNENLDDYRKDSRRLAFLVKYGLKFGVFASCRFEEIKDNEREEETDARLEKTIEDVGKSVDDHLTALGYRLHVESERANIYLLRQGEKKWKWRPVCFVIKK